MTRRDLALLVVLGLLLALSGGYAGAQLALNLHPASSEATTTTAFP